MESPNRKDRLANSSGEAHLSWHALAKQAWSNTQSASDKPSNLAKCWDLLRMLYMAESSVGLSFTGCKNPTSLAVGAASLMEALKALHPGKVL